MKYSYTALSTDNQKLTGILDAESIEAAQEELHKMGLSIISINEISEEEFEIQKTEKAAEKSEGIQTFVFEAIDRRGKEINGTIDAADDYSAYKRLAIEYKFQVSSIYPMDATDVEKAQGKQKAAEFETMMKDEGIDISREEKELAEFGEVAEEMDKKIIEEIDQFIINVKKILEEHHNDFSPLFFRQIENTLGELERVRASNNLKQDRKSVV
jgi:type II secretory pathway component PulF